VKKNIKNYHGNQWVTGVFGDGGFGDQSGGFGDQIYKKNLGAQAHDLN